VLKKTEIYTTKLHYFATVYFWCNEDRSSPSIFIHFFTQFRICCAIVMHFFIVSEMRNVNFNGSTLHSYIAII